MSGSTWVTKTDAVIDQIVDEINGQLGASGEQEFDFIIPNTPANLAFVETDQQVQILWGSTVSLLDYCAHTKQNSSTSQLRFTIAFLN